MSNQANPPIAALSGLNLPAPLLTFLHQLWIRSGGNEDFISTLDFSVTADDSRKFSELRQLTKKVNAQALEIDQLRSEIALLQNQIKPKQGEEVIYQFDKLEKRIKHLELQ